MATPTVGSIVHYVSYGTPGGEYPSTCRAAIVTAVDEYQPSTDGGFTGAVSLCVLNPEGQFFNKGVLYDDGAEKIGSPCTAFEFHGNPFRYCGECGWREAALKGGTWHWPEPADA